MKILAHLKSILAIKSPKLSRRGVQGKLIKHKIRGFLFACTHGGVE